MPLELSTESFTAVCPPNPLPGCGEGSVDIEPEGSDGISSVFSLCTFAISKNGLII